jgi:hypothetical protein
VAQAAGGKGIDMGRPDDGITVTAEVVGPLPIGDDKQEIDRWHIDSSRRRNEGVGHRN